MAEVSVLLSGDRPLPYVYRLTHRETGRFYIGVRCKNVALGLKSEDDLGTVYKSSSKEVKEHFDEYEYVVIAECFDKYFAFDLERQMIRDAMGNPLLINKRLWGFGYNPISPLKGRKLSPEHVQKIVAGNLGRKRKDGTGEKISKALTGRKQPWSEEQRKSYREKMAVRPVTDEWRQKLSEGQHRRFQNPEQHESNRRAGEAGYWARKIKGFKILRVSSQNGRVSVMYSSATVFAKAIGISKSAIFRRANEFSGVQADRGILKGLAFSWVDD